MADSSKRPRVGPSASESVDDLQAGQSWYFVVTRKSYDSFDDFYDAVSHAQRTGKPPGALLEDCHCTESRPEFEPSLYAMREGDDCKEPSRRR
jgi:hypothetical protein